MTCSQNNKEIIKEDKIFKAAHNVFLLYGFHGTTMQQIADEAEVRKASIHYYFRSKEKLYFMVVYHVTDNLFGSKVSFGTNQKINEKQKWFLFTELYNNKHLFVNAIKNLYPNDWEKIVHNIEDILKDSFMNSHDLESALKG